jgi:tetratricopeptide (TPR) repeat protein
MYCRKFFPFLLPILSFIFIACGDPRLSDKEIPVTTSSAEALDLFLEGRELHEDLKTPQAAELFDRAIALDENFAKAYLYRSRSGGGYKVFRDNLAKAVELVDMVSEGEKHEILYFEARADNDGVKEKRELDALLKLYPSDKRVHDMTGHYYYDTVQDYDKALEHYGKTVELDPDYAPVYNSFAYLNVDLENYEEAEKHFKKYIELIPDAGNPYDSYAEFLTMTDRYEEAIEQYKKALEVDDELVFSYAGLGNCCVFESDFDKAREYYQMYYDNAFNVNQKLGALYWKATSYVYEGDYDAAIKVLAERSNLAEANNSPNSVVWGFFYSAWILDEQGRFDEAAEFYNKADEYISKSKLIPVDKKTYAIFAGLNRCYHEIMMEDLDTAENNMAQLMITVNERQDPVELQTAHFFKGMLEYKKENWDKAFEHMNKGNRESQYIWYWKALTFEKAGRLEEARELYLKIANSNENNMGLAMVRSRAAKRI